jgi:DNA-binding phage protein
VADFADKNSDRVFRKFDGAVARLTLAVRDHESKLSAPVQQAAAAPIAAEIRSFVKTLKQGERASFMNDALKAGDTQTVTAVLGAPAYLSGLTEVEKQVHTRTYHSKANPDLSARLAIMTKAKELLEQRGPLLYGELEKAIGGSWAKVNDARQAASKSKAAFAFAQQ